VELHEGMLTVRSINPTAEADGARKAKIGSSDA
jgi:hypothetical protein